MSEYIEREAIQKRLNRIVEVNNLRTDLAWFTPYGVNALIEEIPAADVRPVVHGHNTGNARIFECSECGYGFSDIFLTNERDYPIDPNYCPNCGADMREEQT